MGENIFRAYHKKHGMIYPDEYFSLEDAIEGNLSFFGSPAKDYDTDDFIFTQWIGLSDKKNEMIFEDDIVRYTHPAEYDLAGFESVEHIRRSEDTAGFELGAMSHRLTVYDDVEILGNIHEHPHLLEKHP